ncbi:hypothetical protein PCANC_27795, partial [Puccinia coronata f. sp. avenae]
MGNSSDSSDDGRSTRSKLEKLSQHNWSTWKPRFKNIITAKGYKKLMNKEWVDANKGTAKFRQMSAWAMNKLYTVAKSEFHPILATHVGNIYGAFKSLSTACGETSVLTLCDKLFNLINMSYNPETSMAQHLSEFRHNYTALKTTMAANPGFMTISTGLAAALLLRSFNQEESMTPLIQSLYNLNPLTFEKVYDCLLIEDTRKASKDNETAFHTNQQKKVGKRSTVPSYNHSNNRGYSSSRGSHQGGSTSRGNFWGVKPTRPAPNRQDEMTEQFTKMFNAQWSKHMVGQANLADDKKDEEFFIDDPEDTGFMILDEANASGIPVSPENTTLIFDSGASKSTLCDYHLLVDPKPVTKAINTYSGSISITHVGKFNLGGTLIYPVYFAPKGPRNLISASQLEDHGLRVIFKNRLILICLGQKVIYRFPQVGNLYQGLAPRTISANYVLNVSDPSPDLDYHILLGHPSDKYLRQFLCLNQIKTLNPQQTARNCEVCIQCKLKRTPHINPLPTADRPFKTLHMDVLQISPPSKTSLKYVLVIIDDYSRFNRIYLMKNKSDSESKILSFINEIVNKTGITVEAGPADSPQTNGLAERFNQTLLVKMRCLLAQSSVPINHWDEAAKYASTLINILPSKALNWSSPVNVLAELNLLIEPVRDINKMVPFGLKVYVSHRPPSKISNPSRPLICLGYEPNSDALRFFDPTCQHVVISRDYKPSKLAFPYNLAESVTKPPDTLPKAVIEPKKSSNKSSRDVVMVKINPIQQLQHPKSSSKNPDVPPH